MSTSQDDVPEAVFEQDVADGGSVAGQLPAKAAAVVIEGVSLVREAPPLAGTFNTLPVGQGQVVSLGRNTRRRRLILAVYPNSTATAYVVIGDNPQQVLGGVGLPLVQGATPVTFHYAGQLYIAAFNASVSVGFLAELDQG